MISAHEHIVVIPLTLSAVAVATRVTLHNDGREVHEVLADDGRGWVPVALIGNEARWDYLDAN